jgi:hypothetical protein
VTIKGSAALIWRFRYYLLCTMAAVVFWDTPFIYPFKLFMVVVHEVCHAAAALGTGGEVLEMKTEWDESGHTLTRGGIFPLISAAGYVGSAALGALLIYTGKFQRAQRLVLAAIGLATMLMTMWFTPFGLMDSYLGIFGGLVILCMAIKSQRASTMAATWLGIMLCLYSLHDFRTDLWQYPEMTDAGILARSWGVPILAYPIALTWVVLSLGLMHRALRAIVKDI